MYCTIHCMSADPSIHCMSADPSTHCMSATWYYGDPSFSSAKPKIPVLRLKKKGKDEMSVENMTFEKQVRIGIHVHVYKITQKLYT